MRGQPWTEKEEQILRESYEAGGRRFAHRMLTAAGYDRTYIAVANRAKKLKIRTHQSGQFRPGQTPWNKGKKMTQEMRDRVSHSWFQKGQDPPTTKHDGCITVRTDTSTGRKYKWIRVAKGKWQHLHRHMWEQEHGPIPKGMLIVFKDGDSLNCVLENLEMISRKEHRDRIIGDATPAERLTDGYVRHVLRNYYDMKDEDITPAIIEVWRAKMKMERAIKKIENE